MSTSQIVIPLRAEETGLLRPGMNVIKDTPEGEVDLTRLGFIPVPISREGYPRDGDEMLDVANQLGVWGSLGLGKILKDSEPSLILPNLHGKRILLPLTWLNNGRILYLAMNGGRWDVLVAHLELEKFGDDWLFIVLVK